MTCKDCVHEKVCKNAYLFKVTPPNVCSFFKNKADFVEVVRCRECKHCEIWNNDWFFCKKTVNDAEVIADDFCSYGERREVCHGK